MDRTTVTSSNIASVGYDLETRTLEVEFKHGGVYQYAEVPPEDHAGLMAADSKGKFLNERIKLAYGYSSAS